MSTDLIRTRYRFARAERFAPPEPCDEGPTGANAICPQSRSRLEAVTGPPRDAHPLSEDCLLLSVVAPRTASRPRPVLVFFHGGGFGTGTGLHDWYDGARLAAEHDVVVVSANYRLGPFGYLVLDGVSDGDLGLLDQVTALEWVQHHAVELGGDPANVTVVGQSAGAISIDLLIDRSHARALFRRAILQSGPRGLITDAAAAGRTNGNVFAGHLGTDPRHASVDEVLAAFAATARDNGVRAGNPVDPPFVPTHESLGTEPDGDLSGLELIIGWNADEMTAFGWSASDAAAVTERRVAQPTRERVARWRAAGATVTGYELTWRPDGSPLGATHCVELPLLLGDEVAWRGAPLLGDAPWADVEDLGRRLRSVWAGFARTGQVDTSVDLPMRWM